MKQKKGDEDVDLDLLFSQASSIPGSIAKELGICGVNYLINTACCSGTTSIGLAKDYLMKKKADVMLAGGFDLVSEITFSGFTSLGLMSQGACKPFSNNRDGLNLGEGSAVFILERKSSAIARKAKIYGEILGYGMLNEAHHPTAPNPSGESAAAVMSAALNDAKIQPQDIDYVNGHGTATNANDIMELNGIQLLFGKKMKNIVSNKSQIGHTLGAAGSLELACILLSFENGFQLKTMNSDQSIEGFDHIDIEQKKRTDKKQIVLSNSFAFAGHLSALVVKE
jgi:3-oxoacyl-[acyl-carrier-protein] synthase II